MPLGCANEKSQSQWVANGDTGHAISASFGPKNDGRLRSMGRAVCAVSPTIGQADVLKGLPQIARQSEWSRLGNPAPGSGAKAMSRNKSPFNLL